MGVPTRVGVGFAAAALSLLAPVALGDPCAGAFTVDSQSAWDSIRGCSTVGGTLAINIAAVPTGASSITAVSGNLEVLSASAATSIYFVTEFIASVVGEVKVLSDSVTAVQMPALVSAGGVTVSGCDAVTTAEFPSLTTLGNDATASRSMYVSANAALVSLEAPLVATMPGGFYVTNCDQLVTLDVARNVVTSAGQFDIRNLLVLSSLGLSFQSLDTAGSVYIDDCAQLSDISSLSNLREVTTVSSLMLMNLPLLTDVNSVLAKLERVHSVMKLQFVPGVTSLHLPSLHTHSWLQVHNCDNIASITLPAVTTMDRGGGDSISLQALPALTQFSAPQLASISGGILIKLCNALTTFSTPQLTTIGSDLYLENVPSLTTMDWSITTRSASGYLFLKNTGFADLTMFSTVTTGTIVGGVFGLEITGNSALTSLAGLAWITETINDIRIENNGLLTSIDGFDGLVTVGRHFDVVNCDNIVVLSTRSIPLTSCDGRLGIRNSNLLESLGPAFDNLATLKQIEVYGNAALEVISLPALTGIVGTGSQKLHVYNSAALHTLHLPLLSTCQSLTIANNPVLSTVTAQLSTPVDSSALINLEISDTGPGWKDLSTLIASSSYLTLSTFVSVKIINTKFTHLNPLSGISQLGMTYIESNTELVNLSGLSGVTSFGPGTVLRLKDMPKLTSIAVFTSGFSGEIWAIEIEDCNALEALPLSGISRISRGGHITIKNNAAMQSIDLSGWVDCHITNDCGLTTPVVILNMPLLHDLRLGPMGVNFPSDLTIQDVPALRSIGGTFMSSTTGPGGGSKDWKFINTGFRWLDMPSATIMGDIFVQDNADLTLIRFTSLTASLQIKFHFTNNPKLKSIVTPALTGTNTMGYVEISGSPDLCQADVTNLQTVSNLPSMTGPFDTGGCLSCPTLAGGTLCEPCGCAQESVDGSHCSSTARDSSGDTAFCVCGPGGSGDDCVPFSDVLKPTVACTSPYRRVESADAINDAHLCLDGPGFPATVPIAVPVAKDRTIAMWANFGVPTLDGADTQGAYDLRLWSVAWAHSLTAMARISLVLNPIGRTLSVVSRMGTGGEMTHISTPELTAAAANEPPGSAAAVGKLRANDWMHVAVSLSSDGSQISIILDGTVVAGPTPTTSIATMFPYSDANGDSPELRVGDQWIGAMDGVVVYAVGASPATVKQGMFYAGHIPGYASNLVAREDFDTTMAQAGARHASPAARGFGNIRRYMEAFGT